jgi:ribosome-associated heat shock protein Hsp15
MASAMERNAETMDRVRVDKFLWAARFYKTRSISTEAIDGGRVRINGERVKPAKEVKVGDRIELRAGDAAYTIVVKALADKRGSADVARTLYDETADSMASRATQSEKRRRLADPAEQIIARPTKKDRRTLDRFRGG